jgi:hypothetical protein
VLFVVSRLAELPTILLGKRVLLLRFVLVPAAPMFFSVDELNLTIIVLFILDLVAFMFYPFILLIA